MEAGDLDQPQHPLDARCLGLPQAAELPVGGHHCHIDGVDRHVVPTVSKVKARRGPHRKTTAASNGRTVSRAPSSLVSTAQPNSRPAQTARGQSRRDGGRPISEVNTRYPSITQNIIAVSSRTRSFCRMQNGSRAKSNPATAPARSEPARVASRTRTAAVAAASSALSVRIS